VEAAKKLSVGDPTNDDSFMGALISKAHLEKVQVNKVFQIQNNF
jgi:acyl-CoA reductase-like NAD-dependent aldehyde dehydrogenase